MRDRETSFSWPRPAPALISSRIMSIAAVCSRTSSRNSKDNPLRAPPRKRPERTKSKNHMPRTLQPDRQLFVVTLALCFIGAVMVFSASAMTAREQFGNGYIFLLRQLVYIALGIGGMFWLMKTDSRTLRQPRVIFT